MKKLILHIEIDGYNAEGLDDGALYLVNEVGYDMAEARLDVALNDWAILETVGVTIVKQPNDGEDGPSVWPYSGRIVGAEEGAES